MNYKGHTVHADIDSDAYKFFVTTQDLYLFQYITEDTRKREGTTVSVLDYVFTDEDRIIQDLKYETPIGWRHEGICSPGQTSVLPPPPPSGVFRNLKRYISGVHFQKFSNFSIFFTVNISTIFFTSKGAQA